MFKGLSTAWNGALGGMAAAPLHAVSGLLRKTSLLAHDISGNHQSAAK